MASKLAAHGFEFHNWAGGEEAAEGFGISHAVVVPANARTIVISGQVGIRDDGTIPSDLEEQITEAFDHVERSLKAVGLGEDAWEYVYSVSLLIRVIFGFSHPIEGERECIALANDFP
jgi:enamine deaminase RidA (YjgF/YER057c/UK114 family)